MKKARLLGLFALLFPLVLAGCPTPTTPTGTPTTGKGPSAAPPGSAKSSKANEPGNADKEGVAKANEGDEKEIRENLAKLSPEDRKLAEAQKYCAVNNTDRLGEMDVPVKIVLNGKPVFLCCGACEKQAKKDPDKTLAKVEELKKKAAEEAKK